MSGCSAIRSAGLGVFAVYGQERLRATYTGHIQLLRPEMMASKTLSCP